MAKKSSIEKNKHRRKLVAVFAAKRKQLHDVANDDSLSMEERFEARIKLAALPRNSAPTRIRKPVRGHRAGRARITASSACRASRCASSGRRG